MAEKNYGNNSQLAELVKYISDEMKFPIMGAGGGFAPIGTESYFDGQVAPLGWVICDGTELNISDYPDLATYYASQHGASNYYGGNGTTTFATPKRSGMPSNEYGVYGENERIIGVWRETVDGVLKEKPVYKLCIPKTKLTTRFNAIIQESDYEKMVDSSITLYSQYGYIWSGNVFAFGGNIRLGFDAISSWSQHGIVFDNQNSEITHIEGYVCYTKTSDTWQLPQYGHSADGNGVFCVKATLSDTELNNMHVYSPNEHQVGWWQEEVDGVLKQKPVYEKTFDNIPYTNVSVSNVERILNWNAVRRYESNSNYYVNMDGTISTNYMLGQFSNNTFVLHEMAGAYNAGNIVTATIRYTKTTDQWQTV